MSTRPYQMCVRCIMDTSDPFIEFDAEGVCNHCHHYEMLSRNYLPSPEKRDELLNRLVAEIKAEGRGRDYDCIIGVSGGVDSTYVAYLVKKLGLRALAVHVDNGWDSELSSSNVEKSIERLGIDLQTVVLDWEEFKDLQIAFLKASTPDSEIPTDHAIFAVLYHEAAKRNIRYIVSGGNVVTEAILPGTWAYGYFDWRYIKNIQRRFGQVPLRSFPHINYWDRFIYYPLIKQIKIASLLDFVQYDKKAVQELLERELDWRPYGGKHYESVYTRFFQGYILPRKFGIDKRRAHLSTLILSGQISRAEALEEIHRSPYVGYALEEDLEYVLEKLGLTQDEFEQIMSLPVRSHKDYPTYEDYPPALLKLDYITTGRFIYALSAKLPEPVRKPFRQIKRKLQKNSWS